MVCDGILTADAILACRVERDGVHHGGFGLGTAVLLLNATLLGLYTLSCHSCRHIIGGKLTHFSKHPVRYRFWVLVSKLNGSHMKYAWVSLFGVALTDLYIRFLATDACTDPRVFAGTEPHTTQSA